MADVGEANRVRELIIATETEGKISYLHDLKVITNELPQPSRYRWRFRDPSVDWGPLGKLSFTLGFSVSALGVGILEGLTEMGHFGQAPLNKYGLFFTLGTSFFELYAGQFELLGFKSEKFGPLTRTAALTAINCAAHLALFATLPGK